MKRTLLLFLSIFSIILSEAQRVDLDRFNFSVSYRDFPEDPLPQEFKTYNVRVEASPSLGLEHSMQNMQVEISVEGLKKVEGTGHITVLLMMDDIIFEKTDTKERIQTSKDKEGNEIKKSFFSTELTYSFAARMSIYDYKGSTLISNRLLYDRSNKRIYKTPESSSADEARGYYTGKSSEIRTSLARQLTSGVLNQANEWLNAQYGYPVRRVNDILWILNNKRHRSYSDHQKAWNDFRNAIVHMNENEPVDKVKQKLKTVIDYFEKAKKQYTSSDREDRKMRYASYYNLAKIYLYLDEPDKAIVEADALAMNDFDERDGRTLRAVAEALAEKLRKNNASTRHFEVAIASFEPPVK